MDPRMMVWAMLVMTMTGVKGQEEGFISHVAQNIQAARDPFFQAEQMAELESVFAFGEKFNFNEKQIDLNKFYGNGESKDDEKEKLEDNSETVLRKNDDRGNLSEQTERSGLKGWFDSFDFGNRNFFNSRHQPQSPDYMKASTPKNSVKETYDKEVKNESRRRVFANFRSSTAKPEEKTETKFLPKVQKWKIATRRPIVKTEKPSEGLGGGTRAVTKRPNLKSSWGNQEPVVSQLRQEENDSTKGKKSNLFKEFNSGSSTKRKR